jgi:hypothetical protein
MSHGPNIPSMFRRAADYVDKILRIRPSRIGPRQRPSIHPNKRYNRRGARGLCYLSAVDCRRLVP